MTIEEIKRRKAELDAELRRLVAAFEDETGCRVTGMQVSRMDTSSLDSTGYQRRSHLVGLESTVVIEP